MNPVAATALADAISALGADSGTVHVAEGRVLKLAAWQGGMPEPVLNVIREIPWGKGMAGLAAERVAPVGTCNIQTTTSTDVRPGARATQLQGALVVPMLLGDEVVGTIGVGCRGERTFTAAETERLWQAGRALARALAPPALDVLRSLLAGREGLSWLQENIAAAQHGDAAAVETAFPAVSRRLGREPLGARGALVRRDGVEVPLRAFRVDDAARVALVAAWSGDATALAHKLYFQGDLRERAGALRALALVGTGDGAVDVLTDAMRLAADELVDAALADNPYVAALPAHEFRRAVLKCAFIGVSLDRVVGLRERADVELTESLWSLVREREAAGRAVPADLWPAMAAAPVAGLCARLLGALEHADPVHRAAAARALGRLNDPRARPFLDERMARERDDDVRTALSWALG